MKICQSKLSLICLLSLQFCSRTAVEMAQEGSSHLAQQDSVRQSRRVVSEVIVAFDEYASGNKDWTQAAKALSAAFLQPHPAAADLKLKLLDRWIGNPDRLEILGAMQLRDGEASNAELQRIKTKGYDRIELMKLAYRYPLTKAGQEALLLAARVFLASGEYEIADGLFERYKKYHLQAETSGRLDFEILIARKRSGRAFAEGELAKRYESLKKKLPFQVGEKFFTTMEEIDKEFERVVEFKEKDFDRRWRGRFADCGAKEICWYNDVYALIPNTVPGFFGRVDKKIIDAAIGDQGVCAIYEDKTLKCFGRRLEAVYKHPPKEKVKFVTLHHLGGCALLDDDSVSCWGHAKYIKETFSSKAKQLIAGQSSACIIDQDSKIQCLGFEVELNNIPKQKTLKLIGYSGDSRLCSISAEQKLDCWSGSNNSMINAPQGKVKDAVLQHSSASAILEDGTLTAWGFKGYSDAVQVPAGKAATLIGGSETNTCAVMQDETVKCWGYKDKNGNQRKIVQDVPKEKVISVSMNSGHACAILKDRTVKCWGDIPSVPEKVAKAKVQQVITTFGDSCALLEDQSVECWGYYVNQKTSSFKNSDPLKDLAKGKVRRLVQKANEVCAIYEDGGMSCWGSTLQITRADTDPYYPWAQWRTEVD